MEEQGERGATIELTVHTIEMYYRDCVYGALLGCVISS